MRRIIFGLFLFSFSNASDRHDFESEKNIAGKDSSTFSESAIKNNKNDAKIRELLNSANTQIGIGNALIVTGLIIQTLGASSQNGQVALFAIPIGYISRQVGLPVLGFGADKIGEAMRLRNPNYYDGDKGWGAYENSLFFGGIGLTSIIVPGFIYLNKGEKSGEKYGPYLAVGIISLTISEIWSFVSWYGFNHRANLSKMDFNREEKDTKIRIELLPFVALNERGRPISNFKIGINF